MVPVHELRGFERICLKPGKSQKVSFELDSRDLSLIDDEGRRMFHPGKIQVFVGGSQPDKRSSELLGQEPLSISIELVGDSVEMPY